MAAISDLQKGLVGHWTCDDRDVENGVIRDRSAFDRHGSIPSGKGITTGVSSPVGEGFSFAGNANQQVEAPISDLSQPNAFSTGGWIKYSYGSYQILTWGKTSGGNRCWWFGPHQNNGDIQFDVDGTSNADGTDAGSSVLSENTWHHVFGTFTGTRQRIYVDGQIVKEKTFSGNQMKDLAAIWMADSGGSHPLSGSLTDVRTYNRELTTTEVYELYQKRSPAAVQPATNERGLVGYWTMNSEDVRNGTIVDKSGEGNDGTINGTVSTGKDGIIGEAIAFDSDNISANPQIGGAGESFTVYGWLKSPNQDLSQNYFALGNYPGSGHDGFYTLGTNDGSTLFWWLRDSNKNDNTKIGSADVFDGSWHQIVGVRDAQADELHLFVDGVHHATGSMPGDVAVRDSDSEFSFMQHSGRVLQGELDDVRLYDRALPSQEVKSLYNNRTPRVSKFFVEVEQDTASLQWLESTWSYRQKITISSSQIPSDLTDFPVYVDLSTLSTGFFSNIRSDGGDIRVTKSDGKTQVPTEVVSIDTTAGTGELHFKVETLDSSADNEFYIYYGNSNAIRPDPSNSIGSENVWTNGYEGVWHSEENPTSNDLLDSTLNNNDGIFSGSPQPSLGKLGQGVDYEEGSDEYADLGIPSSLDFTGSDALVASAWIKMDSLPGNKYGIVQSRDGGSTNNEFIIFRVNSDGSVAFAIKDESGTVGNAPGTGSLSSGNWYKIDAEYDGNGNFTIYIDGSSSSTDSESISGSIVGDPWTVALADAADIANSTFDGVVDEVRISRSSRGSDWISAEYTNQNSPSTFFTVGTEESVETAFTNEQWEFREKITIQSSEIPSDVTDFPVYLDLSQLSSHFFDKVQQDGADIRVTTDDGVTQVPREVVNVDPSAETGEVHFKVSTLSASEDTEFYVYYGNQSVESPAVTAANGRNAVWSKSHQGVWHFEGNYQDSSPAGNDGSKTGTTFVNGQVGQGVEFNDANLDNVEVQDISSTLSQVTASAWVYANGIESIDQWILAKETYFEMGERDGNIQVAINNTSPGWAFIDTGTAFPTSRWFHLSFRYEDGLLKVFLDGSEIYSDTSVSGDITDASASDEEFMIGNKEVDGNFGEGLPGYIDEPRLLHHAVSPAWVSAQYSNQNSPSTFYVIGEPEYRA